MEGIRIKCPNCGVLLGVKEAPKDVDKLVTCPNCKERNRFRDYRQVEIKPVQDETEIAVGVKDSLGKLIDTKTRKRYPLHEGVNLIGRMTYKTPPKADIPIVTDDLGLSRAHLFIQVMRGRDGLYHYYAYNASNVNQTYLNDAPLEDGDKVGLKSGDKIRSSETVLQFEGNIIDVETEL